VEERDIMDYALIGCGRIGPSHLKAAKANGFNVVAVCDVDENAFDIAFDKAQYTQEERENIRRYLSVDDLLSNEKPTLISIAVPSGTHAEIAFKVIEAGINCIIEKPIAMNLGDADRIIELADKHKVKVAACHQNRFNIAVQEMRAALEKGRFGRLSNAAITIRWSRDEGYYSSADWRGKWASDGGTLMNQCIHGIDLLRWMCGDEIKSVYGITKQQYHPYIEAEDVGCAVIEFANGVIATVEGTINLPGKDMEEHLTLIGEKGAVKLGGTSANTIDFWNFPDTPDDVKEGFHEKTINVYGNGHTSLFEEMAQAIAEDRQPYVDARAGRRALETILAIYKSSFTGEKVYLPLEGTASTDFEGLFDK